MLLIILLFLHLQPRDDAQDIQILGIPSHSPVASKPCSSSECTLQPMLSRSSPAAVPGRDSLPLKKRDQRWSSPPPPQQGEAATFKAPYPRRSCGEPRVRHAGPLRPSPKRVPPLHQPWMQPYAPPGPVPQVVSAFRAHQAWPDWRESRPQCLGWDGGPSFQHHLSPLLHAHPSRFSAGLQSGGDREQPGDGNFRSRWRTDERNGGVYLKRSRRAESLPKAPLQMPAKLSRNAAPGHPSTGDSEPSATLASAGGEGPPTPRSSRPPNRLPWLLPHFLAGSLIELRDGRLRRVEHLQTEDFLLGALGCPDLRLSCCTVQSITPSASSSISRLLILLHDQQSQELVDVYVEYPFFVQDRGWSSCSPQRTAHLCGLRCRQLSVGDVCLALTPLSAPRRPLTAEPRGLAPRGRGRPAGEQRREPTRRRHRSAPELRGSMGEGAS